MPSPRVPLARQTTTSSEEEQLLRTPGNPLYCYYPESIYIADHIPTRKPRELESFKNHCRLQYDTYRLPLEINHPLENIRQITNTPLEFQNLLWCSKVLVTHFGIFEEYQWIRRQFRPNHPERAILQPAYKVFYSWSLDGWSVTRLP